MLCSQLLVENYENLKNKLNWKLHKEQFKTLPQAIQKCTMSMSANKKWVLANSTFYGF